MATLNTSISPAPQVTCYTKGGAIATGFTGNVVVSLSTNPTGATLGGTLTQAASSGVATFSNLTLNRSGKGFVIKATSSNLRTSFSRPFDIQTALVFTTQPVSTAPDTTFTVVVAARDTAGNTDTAYNGDVTVSIYSGTGTLSGTLTRTAVSGVATFTGLSIGQTGTFKLVANGTEVATAYPPAAVLSNTFTVANIDLEISIGDTAYGVDSTILTEVEATLNGSLNTSFTGNVTVAIGDNPSSGTLSGTTTVAAVAGVATFSDLTIDNVGSGYTIVATSSGYPSTETPAFSVGIHTLTAVVFAYNTDGPGIDRYGFDSRAVSGGPFGAFSPDFYANNEIFSVQSVVDTGVNQGTLIVIDGVGLTQNLFTSLTVNGFSLLSASATFTDLGTAGLWEWSSDNLFTAAGSYTIEIQ